MTEYCSSFRRLSHLIVVQTECRNSLRRLPLFHTLVAAQIEVDGKPQKIQVSLYLDWLLVLWQFLQFTPSWLHYQGFGWDLISTPHNLINRLHNSFVSEREDDKDKVWIESDWLRLIRKWSKVENEDNKIWRSEWKTSLKLRSSDKLYDHNITIDFFFRYKFH